MASMRVMITLFKVPFSRLAEFETVPIFMTPNGCDLSNERRKSRSKPHHKPIAVNLTANLTVNPANPTVDSTLDSSVSPPTVNQNKLAKIEPLQKNPKSY